MLNMHTLWILAVAEMRSCRRLARTWVFIVIAVLFCTAWYVSMTEISTWVDPPSGWIYDGMSPRYTVSTMMNAFVAIFSFGIIFLTFDIRARDVQNRIRDVVDSIPATNFEIILGRLAGILLLLLIPCLVFLSVIAGYELTTNLIGFPYRMGIQPMSVVSLIVWNLIPNLVFYGALVACLSTLVRFRVLVAAIALAVLIGSLWVENQIPLQFQEILAQFIGSTMFPSDLAPEFVTPEIFGSKVAFLLISIALLLFAANLLSRTEPRRMVNMIAGTLATGIAGLILLGLVLTVNGTNSLKEEWVIAHQQQNPSSFPDVQLLEGTVDLRPSRRISFALTLTVQTPSENTTESVVFSLNPGYKIQKLLVDNEEVTDFSFDAGLLKVPANLFPEDLHEVHVQAQGKIDERFAYLDQARDFTILTHHSVPRLGLKSSIFHPAFVALMPGSFWYPTSGSATGRDVLEHRQRDTFTTNLSISVPSAWHVATAGVRNAVENQKRNEFQFTTTAPLPELALIASKFDQHATNVEGIEFEILFSKKHNQNLEVLAPITDEIVQWVSARIKAADALSLEYPYGAFYVVEVPSNLRIYGGGWRMDSVLQPPGMMLVRETTLPTAQFESRINSINERVSEAGGEPQESIFRELLNYFGDDEQGGSPFVGFSRNYISHQVSATKRGATALQYLLDQLSNQLITGLESSSIISTADFADYVPSLLIGQTPDSRRSNWATQNRVAISTLPSTWDVLNRTGLVDLDFSTTPIPAYRALLTKGFGLAQTMITHYGKEEIGTFLDQLLTDYQGKNITLGDFLEVASKVGLDFHDWVLPWLEDTVVSGFLVVDPTVSKLEAPELGKAEYQTSFIVHNAEALPGFVRIVWSIEDEEDRLYRWGWGEYSYSEPIFVSGHDSKRIAIQTANPVTGIWLEPFLAQNRAPLVVRLAEYNEDSVQESPALPFVEDVDWKPPETDAIIVDDLDWGFSIVEKVGSVDATEISTNQVTYSGEEIDNGLPVLGSNLGTWSRRYDIRSFGHYRNTHATIAHGEGLSFARFSANLPRIGDWKLEIFLPHLLFNSYVLASGVTVHDDGNRLFEQRRTNPELPAIHYKLEITDGTTARTAELDVANAEEGWNEVGIFEISSTDVAVLFNDWAAHKQIAVYADAIRWTPVNSK